MKSIHQNAICIVSSLCKASNINFDPPKFTKGWSHLALHESHGVRMDFYAGSQSCGISIEKKDAPLYFMLQHMYKIGQLTLDIPGKPNEQDRYPHGLYLVKNGELSMESVGEYFRYKIASGDLDGRSDIVISRDSETFEQRAADIAALLFNQFIKKIMPIVELYKAGKAAGVYKTAA
jgi:hypothetical protein